MPGTDAVLTDVPETMLWTLHGRANEAMRADTVLADPRAIEIYRAIDYRYVRSFGPPNPAFALRARQFDERLARFVRQHSPCTIVNLGEGLETQRYRVPAPGCRWLSVDLPESIAIRERFIPPNSNHQHLALSATDTQWFDAVDADQPVFVSAQGLLMYLQPTAVKGLLQALFAHFPRCRLVFDAIPFWVSRASVLGGGLPLTRHYRTPPMPWGVSRYALRPVLQRWIAAPVSIDLHDFPGFPRGIAGLGSAALAFVPGSRLWMPSLVEIGQGD